VSSHVLAEVAQTVDRVVVIDHGRLVVESSLADLMADARQVVRVRTSQPAALSRALAPRGTQVRLDGDRLEVTGASAEEIGLIAAELSIPLFECVTDTTNLEEMFFQLTAATPNRKDAVR
jgi:ABC-2 type transport system ATP-binding protein